VDIHIYVSMTNVAMTSLAAFVFRIASSWQRASSAGAGMGRRWPARPVRIVNTFAPAGRRRHSRRASGDHLSGAFKQQFFVETPRLRRRSIGVQTVATREP